MVVNLTIPVGGGLGDLFLHMFYDGWWGRVKAWKQANWDGHILRAVVSSHNPEAAGVVEVNPYIDTVETYPAFIKVHTTDEARNKAILRRYGPNCIFAANYKPLMSYKYETPEIYLGNQAEYDQLEELHQQGPYITFHPFAGQAARRVPPISFYEELAEAIVKKLDVNVVIIGSSYTRSREHPKQRREIEIFESNNPRIFSLVGKTTGRLAARIACESVGFVGTWSCFLCAVLSTNMPIVAYIPNNRPKYVQSKTYKNLPKQALANLIPAEPENAKALQQKAINWFMKRIVP